MTSEQLAFLPSASQSAVAEQARQMPRYQYARASFFALCAALALSGCKSDADKAEAHYQSAQTLLAEGDPVRAMVELRNVFEYDGTHKAARRAYADLLLVDADERSFEDTRHAHCLPLGDTSSEGCAALPELAESHMRRAKPLTEQMLAPVELLLLLTGLGGGAGTGAAHALAAQAKQNGALVLSVAATPFEDQPARCDLAEGALPRLEEASDVCVRLSLDRLAWQARERGADWRRDASWVEELVQGIVLTLGRVGLINLDLMDLRAVVGHTGEATLLVAEGDATNPEALFRSARASPLAGLQVEGASGCLLQIGFGPAANHNFGTFPSQFLSAGPAQAFAAAAD